MGGSCFKSSRVGANDKKIVLLMLGLDNAGKTCTAKSIVGQPLVNIAPTVGFSKVDHKYKGFHVTIYDLGGSKSFRGIWHKYYHEVHGFIFVVDSGASGRLPECAAVLKEMLQHNKVRGKPVLLLCNKSDLEASQDEVELVSRLDVESLVNEAECPTRVEASTAVKNQGIRQYEAEVYKSELIRDGYKWLVKTVIANYLDLGQRVQQDVEEELRQEEVRRAEIRRKIEERRKREAEEAEGGDVLTENGGHPPGFVPLDRLKRDWDEDRTRRGKTVAGNADDSDDVRRTSMTVNVSADSDSSPVRRLSVASLKKQNGHVARLDLEPVHVPKKRGLLSKINRTAAAAGGVTTISGGSSQVRPVSLGKLARDGAHSWTTDFEQQQQQQAA